MRRIHEEFIFHLNRFQIPIENIEQQTTSDAIEQGELNLINQMQCKIDALQNEKVLYDNLLEANKPTIMNLDELTKQFEEFKFESNKKLSKRHSFMVYLIGNIKIIFQYFTFLIDYLFKKDRIKVNLCFFLFFN